VPESLQLGNRVEIFCSYAHEDEELRKEFVSSVALLRQQKVVDVWHDKEILAGNYTMTLTGTGSDSAKDYGDHHFYAHCELAAGTTVWRPAGNLDVNYW
jgi:hypothetical protein